MHPVAASTTVRINRSPLLGAFAFMVLLSSAVSGAASPWQSNKHGKLRLLSSLDQVATPADLWLGVQFQPIAGWHVYWKNAGDYGYPPKASWEGSSGIKNPIWFWPAPHRYSLPGEIAAYGYEENVVYPVRVTRRGGAVQLAVQISYLTCADSCVPYKVTLRLDVPSGTTDIVDAEASRAINSFRDQVAVSPEVHPELVLHPRLIQNSHGTYIEWVVHGPEPLVPRQADIFFERNERFTFGVPAKDETPTRDLRIRVPVSTITGGPFPPVLEFAYTFTEENYRGKRLALDDHRKLLVEKIPSDPWTPPTVPDPMAAPSTPSSSLGSRSLGWLMLLGFLGGLILNVMPCVLPVLAIKLLGVLQAGGHSRTVVIRRSLASAAGILVSFLGLAAAAIALRATGHAIGWGIQFQQPLFVALMAAIVFGFALNLWGAFEIGMPRVFGHFATTFGRGETIMSYFVSGIFATLLATPCSAPFLGTAMGFALTQTAGTVVFIFIAAGVGMAFPYLALAVFPGSVRWLPKPGVWMLRVKAVMGILLAATGVWLLTILYAQLHSPAGRPSPVIESAGVAWIPFDEALIARRLSEGRTVFVDVTADWCFTCKFNERFVLQSAEVEQAFRTHNVVMMRADWTNHNDLIGEYLKKFNRAGIPFNVLYKPNQTPITMSEFLTKKQVLHALQNK